MPSTTKPGDGGAVVPYVDPNCVKMNNSYPLNYPSMPAAIPVAGVNICNDVLMTSKAASMDQKVPYYIHNDCGGDPDGAVPGVIKNQPKYVKFIYNKVTQTYQVETGGCESGNTRYLLCAVEKPNRGTNALWLKKTFLAAQPENGPAATTTAANENWKTGKWSCNWNLTTGTAGGYSLQVPKTAATVDLRDRYFSTPISGYWKNSAGETYYAPGGVVLNNTSDSTFILSPIK
jgi:hypothetical protein